MTLLQLLELLELLSFCVTFRLGVVLHRVVHNVNFGMNTSTLTIRLPKDQRQALKRCAKALKKTESEYIRDLLARDLDNRTLNERMGDLAGSVDSSQTIGKPNPLKGVIRKRNWRK
jgi:predicted DNA-binding protein